MTNDATTPTHTKAQKRGQAWSTLRALLAAEQTVRLQFGPAKSEGWLIARCKGIPCYLLKRELPDNVDQQSVELTVKLVSTSRKSRSALVSTRLSVSTAQLQEEAAKRKTNAAKRKAGLAKQADREQAGWTEFNRLKEGDTVTGVVGRSIKSQPKRGKPQTLYFIKVGDHLVGGLREQELPYVDGGKTRRKLARGEQIELRVHRRYQKVDQKTKQSKPKVDLVMPSPSTESE